MLLGGCHDCLDRCWCGVRLDWSCICLDWSLMHLDCLDWGRICLNRRSVSLNWSLMDYLDWGRRSHYDSGFHRLSGHWWAVHLDKLLLSWCLLPLRW